MALNDNMEQARDKENSIQWAIAILHSVGAGEAAGGSYTDLELVNLHTGRAHILSLLLAGATIGPSPISVSTTPSYYSAFTTPKPVNFRDFDVRGAVLGTISAILYSGARLTIWDGPAYASQRLVDTLTIDGGWGISTPGADVMWGVTVLVFGNGAPTGDLDDIERAVDIDVKPTPEDLLVKVKRSDPEEWEVDVAGDALFDFNKADIKPEAATLLDKVGMGIRSRRPKRVSSTAMPTASGATGSGARRTIKIFPTGTPRPCRAGWLGTGPRRRTT